MSGIWLYLVAGILFLCSLYADRAKTRKALAKALDSFRQILPTVLGMMVLVGLVTTFVPPTTIARLIGPQSGALGIVTALAIGSAAMLPSFVAIPLAGSLLKAGAGYPQVAAFISTIMAVGVVSLPLEARLFGWKAAALRNGAAFVTAMVFTLAVKEILV
ncbi:MAG: permease [Geobacter sp.]|nr:permease [Geobacter sp.]